MKANCVDRQYNCCPSKEEWKFAIDVVERLKLFKDISELFSRMD